MRIRTVIGIIDKEGDKTLTEVLQDILIEVKIDLLRGAQPQATSRPPLSGDRDSCYKCRKFDLEE